jgi:hypothetical protein
MHMCIYAWTNINMHTYLYSHTYLCIYIYMYTNRSNNTNNSNIHNDENRPLKSDQRNRDDNNFDNDFRQESSNMNGNIRNISQAFTTNSIDRNIIDNNDHEILNRDNKNNIKAINYGHNNVYADNNSGNNISIFDGQNSLYDSRSTTAGSNAQNLALSSDQGVQGLKRKR